MNFPEVYSATGMMELIQKIGFLPKQVKTFNAIAVENTSPIFHTLHILQQKQCW